MPGRLRPLVKDRAGSAPAKINTPFMAHNSYWLFDIAKHQGEQSTSSLKKGKNKTDYDKNYLEN